MPFYTPFSQPSVRVPDTCSHTQLSCEWWGSNLKFSCLSSQVLLSTKASLQLSILVSLLCTMFLSAQANHLIASSLVGIKICSLENPILRSPYVYVLSGPMQSLVESVLARASALCLALQIAMELGHMVSQGKYGFCYEKMTCLLLLSSWK